MTTKTADPVFNELSSKMKSLIKDSVIKGGQTVYLGGSIRLNEEAQSVLNQEGSPFVGAVYEPTDGGGYLPPCYVLSDEIIDHLSK